MSFCSFSKEFSKTAYTTIENNFITNYMACLNGDAVKVYLYGLYLCQNAVENVTLDKMAEILDLRESKVIEYFNCWQELGLINVISIEPFAVKYLPCDVVKVNNENIGGKYKEFCKSLKTLFPKRDIYPNEFTEYYNVMEDYHIRPEAMLMIAQYCINLKGDEIRYSYILKVAKNFADEGANTIEKVEEKLANYSLSIKDEKLLKELFEILCLKQSPTIWDRSMLKKWRGWKFNADFIMKCGEKAKGKKSPFAYMDKIISTSKDNGVYSVEELEKAKPKAKAQTYEKTYSNQHTYSKDELDDLSGSENDIDIG